MRLSEAAEPTFARHETFHPRYGWFRKAVAFSAGDPGIFTREDAPVRIGVGKNMVRAIRFWGLAAKLITEDRRAANPRTPGTVPTQMGFVLFDETGWDPYMEDPGTLWLLHWLLLAPRCRLPVWWIAFHDFHAVEFADPDLEVAVTAGLDSAADWKPPNPSSVKKDITALLRAYGPAVRSRRSNSDDLVDCPLRELNLIGPSVTDGCQRFSLGPKPTLPSEVAAYAVLDYISRTRPGRAGTITLSQLAREPGSPARAFKMSETDLSAALEPAVEVMGGGGGEKKIGLGAVNGASQLAWQDDPAVLAPGFLDEYYGSSNPALPDFRAGHRGDRPIEEDLLEDLRSETLLETHGLGLREEAAV